MDDFRHFDRSGFAALGQTFNLSCKDDGMDLKIMKEAVLTIERWNREANAELELGTEETIADPEVTGYQYIGLLELDDNVFNTSDYSVVR